MKFIQDILIAILLIIIIPIIVFIALIWILVSNISKLINYNKKI